MLKITNEMITGTKKEIIDYLLEKENWFIRCANVFQEATMVSYINRGLNDLHKIKCDDETEINMYDKNEILQFDVVE